MIEGGILATNENRVLIDDALMLLRSKVKRLDLSLTLLDKALQSPEIDIERVSGVYNEFYEQVSDVEEFLNMLYDVVARILGYEVEEEDE